MTNKNRRKFVAIMGASTVAIPVSALVSSLPSYADDAPMVDETSAAAINWEYKAKSDVADSMCSNCALYQGEDDSKSGGCPLFPGSQVASGAWCKAYAPKPS